MNELTELEETMQLLVYSGPQTMRDQGRELINLVNKALTSVIELEAIGRFFPPQFKLDMGYFRNQVAQSAKWQCEYASHMNDLRNRNCTDEVLIKNLKWQFRRIYLHLTDLVETFPTIVEQQGFVVEGENLHHELQVLLERDVIDEGPAQPGMDVESLSSESIDEGPAQPGMGVESLSSESIGEGPAQPGVDEESIDEGPAQPGVGVVGPVEPVSLVPAQVPSGVISSIEFSIPLNCFTFRGVPIHGFSYFQPNCSLAVNPGLELKYATNGWSAMFNTEINFTIANRIQSKNKPLARISIQKDNNIAQVSVDTNSNVNLNYSHHVGTVQNTDVRCGINLNMENTVVQLSDLSFKAKLSPHGDALNPSFVCNPSLSLQAYPFWNHYTSPSQGNGHGQVKMLDGGLANFQSSDFVFGFVKKAVLQNSFESTKPYSFNKADAQDLQIGVGVLPIDYPNNQAPPGIPVSSLIFVGILAAGVFTLSFLKKLFKFKD